MENMLTDIWALQDKWIKLLLGPEKVTATVLFCFVLFLKHNGRHAEREKNKHKLRKRISVVFISTCISSSITLKWH